MSLRVLTEDDMAKKTKKIKEKKASRLSRWWEGISEERRHTFKRGLSWTIVTLVGMAATALGMKALERHVLEGETQQLKPMIRVVLTETPPWFPESQIRRIEQTLSPGEANFNDPQLTSGICRQATRSPWVRKVHSVSKRLGPDGNTGAVEVRAELRRPIARVQTAHPRWVCVDGEGVVLPTDGVPRWAADIPASGEISARRGYYVDMRDAPKGSQIREVHYILIQGVKELPPQVGQRWEGDDLSDALRLVELLLTRPYANQITVVDVSNHAGRISQREPEIRIYAQVGDRPSTEIRFGRFPLAGGGDIVVSPQRKMSYLDQYASRHSGHLAGFNRYVDLRYDELRYSIR